MFRADGLPGESHLDYWREVLVERGHPHRLLPPPRRSPRCVVVVRQARRAGRPDRDQAAARPRQRPDPTPFFTKYGNNAWAPVKTYQAAQVDYASAPVIKKYTGVLAAADVYTASTTFIILESIRLDLGVDSQVHA